MKNDAPSLNPLTAVSPLDGRYHTKTASLSTYFSEFALIRVRVEVEVEWLIHLSEQSAIKEVAKFSSPEKKFLREIVSQFSLADAQRVKAIEATTNHDVKAVEYFLKEAIQGTGSSSPPANLSKVCEFIHFACTSEDINNLAYALMLKRAKQEVIIPNMQALIDQLSELATAYAKQSMLARTHGQAASPTTMGKEIANFTHRFNRALEAITEQVILGKFNGASGNFNAHFAAYPDLDWPAIANDFVTGLGLQYQPLTTQIEPHDFIAELCHSLFRFNTVLIDLNRDFWSYISLGYFRQKVKKEEVGSSAMPHKVNPIDFENSEGNLGIANALLQHFAATLPISRWQRDLTDSTVLRNLGVAIGHGVLALSSAMKGLTKLELDKDCLQNDLEQNWAVLAEPVQTVMRRYGVEQPYEKLKALTRGVSQIDQKTWTAFIQTLEIPDAEKKRLLAMTPASYIGWAADAANFDSVRAAKPGKK